MPVTVKPEGEKFRVVDADSGKPETNAAGTAVDGGGHATEDEARKQAAAINARKGVRAELVEALRLGLPGFLTSATPEEVAGLALTIRTGEPLGPFGGVTQCPVSVLEMMPTVALKRAEDSRHLFFVPIELEAGEVAPAREAALVTDETEGHHHQYERGADRTGPPIPAVDGDDHTHGFVKGSGQTAETNGHSHRRDPAELGGDLGTVEDPVPATPPAGPGVGSFK